MFSNPSTRITENHCGRHASRQRTCPARLLGLFATLALVGMASAQYPPTKPGSPLLEPQKGPDEGPVEVRLLSDVAAITPGQSFHIVVQFQIERDWSIGWRNAGDIPLGATKVTLAAPEGFVVGEATWSGPMALVTGAGMAKYLYRDHATVAFPVRAPGEIAAAPSLRFVARCEWTAESRTPLPGEAELALALRARAADEAAEPSEHHTEVLNLLGQLPGEAKDLGIDLTSRWENRNLLLEAAAGDLLTFFPHESTEWSVENAAECVEREDGRLAILVHYARPGMHVPVTGVLGVGIRTNRQVKWTYVRVEAEPKETDGW